MSARHVKAGATQQAVPTGDNSALKNSDSRHSQVHVWLVSPDGNTQRQLSQRHPCVSSTWMMLLRNHCHTAGMFMFEGRTANFFFGPSVVVFFFCPCPMKTNSLKHSCRLGRAVWSRFSAILTAQMGFSGKSHFAPNCEVPRTRSTNRRFHINPYQMTANNISFGWIVGDRGIRGF